MGKPIKYNTKELLFIKNNCKLERRKAHDFFCEKFNRIDVNLDNFKSLCKRNGWLTGRTGCFERGHIPSPSAKPKGPNETCFKKGHKPHNYLPVGSELVKDDGYLWVKIADPNVWRQKHLFLYEKEMGPIKKGFLLRFKDGDRFNFDLDNMLLVSLSENMYLNLSDFNNLPDELKPTVRNLAKLQAKMSEVNAR